MANEKESPQYERINQELRPQSKEKKAPTENKPLSEAELKAFDQKEMEKYQDDFDADLDFAQGTDIERERENRTTEENIKQYQQKKAQAELDKKQQTTEKQETNPDANKNIPTPTQTNEQNNFTQEDLEPNPTKQELNESENLHNKTPDKTDILGGQNAHQPEEYDPKYDDRYKATNTNLGSRQTQNDDGGNQGDGYDGGGGGGGRQGGQGQGHQGQGHQGGGQDSAGGGQDPAGGGRGGGGQDQGDYGGGYDGNNYGNRSHRPNDEEGGGGGGGYAGSGGDHNKGDYDSAGNPMSSDMLRDMPDHVSGSNEPPAHANNMQAGWNSKLFYTEVKFIGQSNINDVVFSSNLNDIGAISVINKENSFSQDLAGIADGTILKPAENIAQQETQNLTFEGLETQLEIKNLPKQLTDADSFGGFKHHGLEGQAAGTQTAAETAMYSMQQG